MSKSIFYFGHSRLYFNHANIIQYCNRPFKDVKHMNEEMIRRWNEVVTPQDTVIHLGDFAMGPKTEHKKFFDCLNGYKIVLIRGNHDPSIPKLERAGIEVYNSLELEEDGNKLFLQHIPVFDESGLQLKYQKSLLNLPPECDYVLHGHVHGRWRRKGKYINVGVDVWGFRPRTLKELLAAQDELLTTETGQNTIISNSPNGVLNAIQEPT